MADPSPKRIAERVRALFGDEPPAGEGQAGPASARFAPVRFGITLPVLRTTQPAPPGLSFCPITSIIHFPPRHPSATFIGTEAVKSFEPYAFWEVGWHLYYLHPPFPDTHPLILVPMRQVEAFFKDMNDHILGCRIELPSDASEIGLVTQFPDDPILQPRFLMKCPNQAHFDWFTSDERVPRVPLISSGDYPVPTNTSVFNTFKLQIEKIIGLDQIQDPHLPYKKKISFIKRYLDFASSLARAQVILGFREMNTNPYTRESDLDLSMDDSTIFAIILERLSRPKSVDITEPVLIYDFAVFVSIDVEVWEYDDRCILEIGVSTLDTLDLIALRPQKHAVNWRQRITKHHFRIKENAHLHNHVHVESHPDNFIYGESEWISMSDVHAKFVPILNPTRLIPAAERESHYVAETGIRTVPTTRRVVLVGHDIQNDIRYLRRGLGGFDILRHARVGGGQPDARPLETMDTAGMFALLQQKKQFTSLGVICKEYFIDGRFLHNAGNDAAYTLMALMAIALQPVELPITVFT
ncbi:MAG: hypothetical protein M1821_007465 [Bathelium mastoideum]|nr:MAG: hypothetical protein M1821_007465 [Bathelium mastoideum]